MSQKGADTCQVWQAICCEVCVVGGDACLQMGQHLVLRGNSRQVEPLSTLLPLGNVLSLQVKMLQEPITIHLLRSAETLGDAPCKIKQLPRSPVMIYRKQFPFVPHFSPVSRTFWQLNATTFDRPLAAAGLPLLPSLLSRPNLHQYAFAAS